MQPTVTKPGEKALYWIPPEINPETYTSKTTEYPPGAARRKLKEDNIAFMVAKVPEGIKSQNPTISHFEILSNKGAKVLFDLVNYSNQRIAFDERLCLTVNGERLYVEKGEGAVCLFSNDNCHLVAYEEENGEIIIFNKDIPKSDASLESTNLQKMSVHYSSYCDRYYYTSSQE